jgi:hypothetical protein
MKMRHAVLTHLLVDLDFYVAGSPQRKLESDLGFPAWSALAQKIDESQHALQFSDLELGADDGLAFVASMPLSPKEPLNS